MRLARSKKPSSPGSSAVAQHGRKVGLELNVVRHDRRCTMARGAPIRACGGQLIADGTNHPCGVIAVLPDVLARNVGEVFLVAVALRLQHQATFLPRWRRHLLPRR